MGRLETSANESSRGQMGNDGGAVDNDNINRKYATSNNNSNNQPIEFRSFVRRVFCVL